jgi:hypothetical protein
MPPVPIMPGVYRPPLMRSGSPKRRMKRRARDLALIAEQLYIDAMESEMRAGLLPEAGIELWQPMPATKVKKSLDRVRHELDACREIMSILFP